jgi:hypothetical protein
VVDYGNQEIGIAAAYSKDPQLIHDYKTGDPYRQFARDALGILDPTEQQRQVYKSCCLGKIYGLGAASLARNLGISLPHAHRIMDQMDKRYPVLNAWLARIQTKAAHAIPIVCVHGWSLTASGKDGEERTFLNFPMQANGSEMMRLVIVRAGRAGLKLIAVLTIASWSRLQSLKSMSTLRGYRTLCARRHAIYWMDLNYALTASRTISSVIPTATPTRETERPECVTGID